MTEKFFVNHLYTGFLFSYISVAIELSVLTSCKAKFSLVNEALGALVLHVLHFLDVLNFLMLVKSSFGFCYRWEVLGLTLWDTIFGSNLFDSRELLGLSHVKNLITLSLAKNAVILESSTKVWILEVLAFEMFSPTACEDFFVVFSQELAIIFRFSMLGRHRNNASSSGLNRCSWCSHSNWLEGLRQGSIIVNSDSILELLWLLDGLSRVGTHIINIY